LTGQSVAGYIARRVERFNIEQVRIIAIVIGTIGLRAHGISSINTNIDVHKTRRSDDAGFPIFLDRCLLYLTPLADLGINYLKMNQILGLRHQAKIIKQLRTDQIRIRARIT